MTSHLRILTLNTWMLRMPFGFDIAEDIDERLQLLPDKVAGTGADLIAFQENWDPGIRRTLIGEMCRRGYPFEISAAGYDPLARGLGSGLQIFSRYRLETSAQLRFRDFTRFDESLVSKGALKAIVSVPGVGPIDFITAHLGAVTHDRRRGEDRPNHRAARLRQMDELTAWIESSRSSPVVLLAGDFNADYREFRAGRYTETPSREYQCLVGTPPHGLGLRDCYAEVHGRSGEAAVTDDNRNPYKRRGYFQNAPDAVIDYVFVSPQGTARPVAAQVVFQEAITDDEVARYRLRRRPERLSDHYGVLVTLALGSNA
jgi:endonuclease/exonuclease/phosphatase family metal-dependent hydrolase